MPDVRQKRVQLSAVVAGAALSVMLTACTGGGGGDFPSEDSLSSTVTTLDSIALERTACFGRCPVYRLLIAGTGAVHFESGSPSDASDTTFTDSIPPSAAGALLALARAIDFFDLPDEITPANPDACSLAATDHPSAIVTISMGDTVKRVNHYHGCHTELNGVYGDAYPRLTAFEAAIDSAARIERWNTSPGR
jgi:hypothetical protein